MRRGVVFLLAALALAGCRDQVLELPSGLQATLADTLTEVQPDGEVWLILQVLAPELADSRMNAVETAGDTGFLCETWGVPAAADQDTPPDQIVVQVMSERVERGHPAPGVAQIFAGFRLQNDTCIWEDF